MFFFTETVKAYHANVAQYTYDKLNVLYLFMQAMNKARDELTRAPASAHALPEYKLWEDHWIK